MTDSSIDSGPRGTFRESDGARVSSSDAVESWTPLALEELVATARKYNAVITYKQLAEYVQEASGIRTRALLTNWIGTLLEEVARRAATAGEPPLTSLCVRQDGSIGPGYAMAPRSVDQDPETDMEIYAAEHRLLCYRKYAVDVPADGGTPALTEAETTRRRKAQARAKDAVPVALCPVHFIQLPANGVCDECG